MLSSIPDKTHTQPQTQMDGNPRSGNDLQNLLSDKNSGGQVNMLGTLPKGKAESVAISNLLGLFPGERLDFSVISTLLMAGIYFR